MSKHFWPSFHRFSLSSYFISGQNVHFMTFSGVVLKDFRKSQISRAEDLTGERGGRGVHVLKHFAVLQ